MIPKKIHLCWLSGKRYPAEIQKCLDSRSRLLPDFETRLWDVRDARAIGCQYIDEAIEAKEWAYAADALRFYAIWKEGGIYMDSDVTVTKRFDNYIPDRGCALFHLFANDGTLSLQPAFFIGDKGNAFCREMFMGYDSIHFKLPEGKADYTDAATNMRSLAAINGWKEENRTQLLCDDTIIYSDAFVANAPVDGIEPETFALHHSYGTRQSRRPFSPSPLNIRHLLTTARYRFGQLSKHLFSSAK